ncbi:MAG TPA: YdcF family protein [Candidatus Acidoferrum sp.]|nr:YdcF family protein [Candidatus Acidoferrum sp.]
MPPRERVPSHSQARASKAVLSSRLAILVAAILALVVAGTVAFRGVGRWLVREDPLAHADAIVVLSGGMPYRAEGAADVFHHGYAPEVWLTRPESPSLALAAMNIHFVGEEEYSREVLIDKGVPSSAIHTLPAKIVDTEDEVEEISHAMVIRHVSSVIIVTSPEHTRRVHALWVRLAPASQKAIVRAAAEDPFDRNHWWRNTRDAYSVLRELLGLANAWAGLPIRPHAAGG